ncbi:MAG: DUF6596 domain-containing protein [Myxococcota bacterium]
MSSSHAAVEAAARDAYGKLVAWGARFARDVVAAEDALADALERALRTWPERGVPTNPEAWLLTAARNRLRDADKHDAVRRRAEATITQLHEELGSAETVVDRRLELMLACAHPAIDEAVRAPLMLQVVLGLDASTVARAFMVSPSGMSKRLVRAKAKIKAAAIGFELPEAALWPRRLATVLDAIYAAYGRSWDLGCATDAGVDALRAEALHLSRVVAAAVPTEPEVLALRSLMLYCEARREARTDADGLWVPLDEQDVTRWDDGCLQEAERLLHAAASRATLAACGATHHPASLVRFAPGGVAKTCGMPDTAAFRLLPRSEKSFAIRRAGSHHRLLGPTSSRPRFSRRMSPDFETVSTIVRMSATCIESCTSITPAWARGWGCVRPRLASMGRTQRLPSYEQPTATPSRTISPIGRCASSLPDRRTRGTRRTLAYSAPLD